MYQAISPAAQARADLAARLPRDCPSVLLPLRPDEGFDDGTSLRARLRISDVQRRVTAAGDLWAVLTADGGRGQVTVIVMPWAYAQCNPHEVVAGASIAVWFKSPSGESDEVYAEIAELMSQ